MRAIWFWPLGACSTLALAQSGGGFELSWQSLDGGGGRLGGGEFLLDGVVGQADAASTPALSGGTFVLESGFMAARAEPATDALFDHGFESETP